MIHLLRDLFSRKEAVERAEGARGEKAALNVQCPSQARSTRYFPRDLASGYRTFKVSLLSPSRDSKKIKLPIHSSYMNIQLRRDIETPALLLIPARGTEL